MKKQLLHTTYIFLVLSMFLSIVSPTSTKILCGENKKGPDKFSYTFEQGSEKGNVPGHAIIGFSSPLPSDYTITGGDFQYWKKEGDYDLFLVNNLPWKYELHWYVRCADKIDLPYG